MAKRRYTSNEDEGDYYDDNREDDDDAEPINMVINPFAAVLDDIYDDPAIHAQPMASPQQPTACDNTLNQPAYLVTDAVSYYNQGALCVLLFAHVTEGISIPAIFDGAKQQMVTRKLNFDF